MAITSEDSMDKKVMQGRPVAAPVERATSLAKFSVRPQRLAFIVHTSLGRKQIEEIVLYNTWTWGGFYNVLVPCTRDGISADYLRLLLDYDPDRLIFCGRVPSVIRKDLISRIQPFNAIDLRQLLPTENAPRDFVKAISVPQVLVREVNQLQAATSSRIRIPIIPQTNPFRAYAITHIGLLDDRLRKFHKERLKGGDVDFSRVSTLSLYLSCMDECLRNLYPLRLTQRRLNPTFRMGFSGDAVIAFGYPYEVEGLCMFWNWRMDASDGFIYPKHEAFAYLSPECVKTKPGLDELAAWIRGKHEHGNVTLLGPPALRSFLRGLKKKLIPLLGSEFKHVDTKCDASFIPITKCPESEITKEVGWADNETRFEAPPPEFDMEWLDDEAWVVDCDFYDFRTEKQSYFPPRRPGQLEVLLKSTYGKHPPLAVFGGPWRFSRQGVACLARSKERLFRLRLPEPEDIFESILSQAGYKFKVSDKCGYVRSTTNILKKAGQLKKLRSKGIRDLLYEMANGKFLTQDQIKGVVKPGKNSEDLTNFLLSMLSVSGFFRGVAYRCPSCGVASWYRIETLREILTCTGCARTFQPPLEFDHSFKMSTLLETTVEQGGIPVILTEGILRNLARKTLYTIPGVIATDSKGGEVDIDILASCDGKIICVECKTLDKNPKPSNIAGIMKQLDRDYDMAARLNAEVFAVALLSDCVPSRIEAFVRRKNHRANGPSTIIIKLADMERGYLCRTTIDPLNGQEVGGLPADIRDIAKSWSD
jgi:hypothetical protein